MVFVQSRPPTFSRRRALSGAAALAAVLGVSTMTSAACGTTAPPPPDLDDLTTALERARADSQLATEAAGAHKSPVDALTQVASERSAHAEALAEEIVRMTGDAAPTPSLTTTTTSAASSPPAPPVPTVDDVIDALRGSADGATAAAGALSGYRAGLLGSIAAACTASYRVALNPPGGAR
ncbi:MAG: hypothetical protein K0U76_06710 [Actinomycetia bacterium]|nr:hypothetical protein [Actinomycetes bacterium]MCH9701070.1 hypothetical protein [Actinomycetes bacterium]MCH9762297.1 hypothetical protein [Actinomycetes bacterium]